MKLIYKVVQKNEKKYFVSMDGVSLESLFPCSLWRGNEFLLTRKSPQGDKQHKILLNEFSDPADAKFSNEDGLLGNAPANNLYAACFEDGDILNLDLPDDTSFTSYFYYGEVRKFANKVEEHRKLALEIKGRDGKNFFEVSHDGQTILFDQLFSLDFYHASALQGTVLRDGKSLGNFNIRHQGGMGSTPCFYELSNVFDDVAKGQTADELNASLFNVGDQIELNSSDVFVPSLMKTLTENGLRYAFEFGSFTDAERQAAWRAGVTRPIPYEKPDHPALKKLIIEYDALNAASRRRWQEREMARNA